MAIPCAVVDVEGAPVHGLTREDFRVTDNGVRRIIDSLWLDQDLPLTLGVIVDASESQREQVAEHRKTAIDLLEKILRPGDRAFVIRADEDVRVWADLSSAPAELRREIEAAPGEVFGQPCPKQQLLPGVRPVSQCGASALWNALYDAARLKLKPLPGPKALLILTDGFDSGSTHTWRQAADEAHKADATIYAIEYPSAYGGSYSPDLHRLVVETGGASFRPPAGDYESIVTRLNTDLRRRYIVGFRPEKLTGKVRHDVVVQVKNPDLSVRARKTYFEVPQ